MILPHFESAVQGEILGKDNVPLHYRYWEVPNAKGTVVILHGAADSTSYHMELIKNFSDRGFNVYMMDQRGHGRSGRITKDPGMVHVEHFSDYVDDMETFSDKVLKPNGHFSFQLMGISMGGQIATQFALRRPKEVEKLVLSTPMLGIRFPFGLPSLGALGAANLLRWMGRGQTYAPSEGPPPTMAEITKNKDGRARVSFEMRDWQENPEPLTWGASVRWVSESTSATFQSWGHLKELQMPVLILKAGKDGRVNNTAIDQAVTRIPQAKLITYPDAGHNLLRSSDHLRDPAMRDMFDFLEDTSGTARSGTTSHTP